LAQICDIFLAGSSAPSCSKYDNIERAGVAQSHARARDRDGGQTMAADSERLELAGPLHRRALGDEHPKTLLTIMNLPR